MTQVQSKTVATARRTSARAGTGRKEKVIAILLMAIAILVFLALVSYDAADEANADIHISDLYKVFTGDPQVQAKADTARNWLGLVGAIISDFLIKSTIGYSIFCLPVLLMLFGWTMIREGDGSRLITFTNYTLATALLVSVSFGMLRLIVGGDSIGLEWSGVVGVFIANVLAQLLGRAGGSIVLLTLLFVVIVLAVDLDVKKTANRFRTLYLHAVDWSGRTYRRWRESRASRRSEQPAGEPSRQKAPVRISKPPLEEPALQNKPAGARPARESVIEFDDAGVSAGLQDSESGFETAGKDIPIDIRTGAVEANASVDLHRPSAVNVHIPEEIDYVFPSVDLLDAPRPGKEEIDDEELKANADLLRDTLAQFDVEVDSVSVTPGPVVTLYELVPSSGVKISRIVSLENDIALKLAAKGIRIMAPIPGKSAVGVEIPNHHRSLVTIRSVINSARFRDSDAHLPLAMGKTISGEVFCDDLSKMPHLLMAGSTGSGKSVGINTIIASLLFRLHPSDLKFVIIDPKKIELSQYAKLRSHFLAVSPDVDEDIVTTARNAVVVLKGVELEMERRYDTLAGAGVRNIVDYNERLKSGRLKGSEKFTPAKMPYLIVIIDELADLMITAAREVEEPIARLAQLARAVGIHLIVATQRPSVDVITGVIKANFPARVAYQVASKIDSRTILDMNGAEQLLGNGDMLYLASGSPKPVRLQNAFISTDEVEAIMQHIERQRGFSTPFMLPSIASRKKSDEGGGADMRDDLFEEAARLIVRHQQGSVSLLQRRLKVGYSRAARLVDELEAAGVVGPFDGSKAREVLVESEMELDVLLSTK
jgi:S-DNA-T family DNA segregation ATPase FtsK/SpoIIIE